MVPLFFKKNKTSVAQNYKGLFFVPLYTYDRSPRASHYKIQAHEAVTTGNFASKIDRRKREY